MTKCLHFIVYTLLWLFSSLAQANLSISGDLAGTFSGSATDGSGSYSGNITGSWNAAGPFDNSSTPITTLTASGSFGGLGAAGTWQVTAFDAVNKRITISWAGPGKRGPGGNQGDGSAVLNLDLSNATASGQFQGQVYTDNGVKTLNGTWTIRFQPTANAQISGSVQGSFSGSASYVGAVNGNVTGSWTVRLLADGSIVGEGNGTYNGGNINVASYGTVCICGTWAANLSQAADGQYQLVGAWTHPDVSGTLGGVGGGTVIWKLDLSSVPLRASGNFSGSTAFSVSVPVLGSITVPISASGNWNATLPLAN